MGNHTSSLDALLDRYVEAQLDGDRREALRIILDDGLGAGVAVPDLYLGVVQAAQHRIGELWQANLISVAHEHLATGISQLVLAQLYPLLPRCPSVGRRALIACIDGELHELGGRVVADFLEMAGFDARYLGANLPMPSLVSMVREDPPDLLVLSATMGNRLSAVRDTVLGVREGVGDRLALAVGGHLFDYDPAAVAHVGAEIYGRDARESVDKARRLLLTEAA